MREGGGRGQVARGLCSRLMPTLRDSFATNRDLVSLGDHEVLKSSKRHCVTPAMWPITNATSEAVALVLTTDAVHTRRTSAAHPKR